MGGWLLEGRNSRMADGISEIAPAANPRAPHRLRRRAWKHPRPTVRVVACRTKRRQPRRDVPAHMERGQAHQVPVAAEP